jgi:hypothetical protein
MTHPIPTAALDDRHAFIGMTGSGKTYNAGGAVERLLHAGRRVIVVDPLDVWWGLRLRPDGKTPSPFNVAIIGGAHGDLPLNEAAGKLIGETVATTSESCIVSLVDLQSKASERRFMIGFLDALYRKANGEPVHIVFDEADLWAPQKGGEPQLQALMENIVRRGRVKGLLSWLITQRPAVLSKDVLSQVDGLIAFKLTASQDRDALGAWIEGQADKVEGRRILGSLPALQRGHGVVWVPGRGILTTAAFPEKITFDSSRTPKRGEKRVAGALQPLDLGALRGRLAAVEVEAKANDPKALKARIAELERAARTAAPSIDPSAVEAALRDGYERGVAEGLARGENRAKAALAAVESRLKDALAIAGASIESLDSPAPTTPAPRARPAPATAQPRAAVPRPAANPSGATLAKAERLILTALAQYPDGRTKNQVAILTGYAVNGGGFNNAISAARTAGRLEGSGDCLQITDRGLDDLGPFYPLPHGDALLQHWMGQLGKAERGALQALADAHPRGLSKEEVAARAGYEPSGGGFNNALSRLRSLELIEGRGELRASEALFG